jgi:glucosamine--fructose-6-phosphate aminotransferase (isomerizing)
MLIGGVLKESEEQIHAIVKDLEGHTNFFIIGRGITLAVAKEGALKFKEIAKVHAEAYPISSLKHGPYAVLKKGFPVILPIFDDENKSQMIASLEQLDSREACVIVITNDRSMFDNTKAKHIIEINIGSGALGQVLTIIPL